MTSSWFEFLMAMLATLLRIFHAENGASSCYVNPNESVVIVGEMTSIECVAIGPYIVDSWIQGKAVTEGTKIYQVPAYRHDGTVRINKTLADGYFISYKDDHRMTLQMNETTLSQAGPYLCECEGDTAGVARANVGVVDPEPVLYYDKNLTCTVKFNGSIDASFQLFIRDSNGTNLSQRTDLPFSTVQNSYEVTYNIIDDPARDQTFLCEVILNKDPSKKVVFHRRVNFSFPQSSPGTKQTVLPAGSVPSVVGVSVGFVIIVTGVVFLVLRRKRTRELAVIKVYSRAGTLKQGHTNTLKSDSADTVKTKSSTPVSPNLHDKKNSEHKATDYYELEDCYGFHTEQKDLILQQYCDPADGLVTQEVLYDEISCLTSEIK